MDNKQKYHASEEKKKRENERMEKILALAPHLKTTE